MPVSITVDLGESREFIYYDEISKTLSIPDLADPVVAVGTYSLVITLDDSIIQAETEV